MLEFIKSKLAKSEETADKKTSLFSKFKAGLSKTRKNFTEKIANLVLGKKIIDSELLEQLETILLTADVGVETTDLIIQHLTDKIQRKLLNNPEALIENLKNYLIELLTPYAEPLNITSSTKPFVIQMVGVNGAGKTTTIGKLTKILQDQHKKIMLAAGDTFRAAAIEQLIAWGERNDTPVISQHTGADSASVIFDAFQAAKARNFDILITDTAGRLHTQDNLMQELEKIGRVLKKLDPNAPHETMLILDASIGQNALHQAIKFHQTIGIDSVSITKLDGTAKGGIIFSIANKLKLPIRFVGLGENIDDLKPFSAEKFVEALFTNVSD